MIVMSNVVSLEKEHFHVSYSLRQQLSPSASTRASTLYHDAPGERVLDMSIDPSLCALRRSDYKLDRKYENVRLVAIKGVHSLRLNTDCQLCAALLG